MNVDHESRDEDHIRSFLDRESTRLAGSQPGTDEVVGLIARRLTHDTSTSTAPLGLAIAAALLVAAGVVISGTQSPRGSTGASALDASPSSAHVASCPVTTQEASDSGFVALGSSPIKVSFASAAGTAFFESPPGARWQPIEALWTADPGFGGDVKVRGHRLDGPGELRFGDPADPIEELLLSAAHSEGKIGERSWVRPKSGSSLAAATSLTS
jgi:hypothetical protein